MKPVETDNFVTVPEAAEALGVSQAAVRMAIKQKRLPTVKLAGRNWIPRAEFDAYVAALQSVEKRGKGRPPGARNKVKSDTLEKGEPNA